jgi:hypothetical protein
MKYHFKDYPTGTRTFQEGYTTLVIDDGEARVDLNDPDQVALAEMHGGEPVVRQKSPPKKAAIKEK